MPMHDEKETMNAEAGSFRDKKMGGKRTTFKKKVCKFCAQKIEPDYKNPDMLRRCTTERGKILPHASLELVQSTRELSHRRSREPESLLICLLTSSKDY